MPSGLPSIRAGFVYALVVVSLAAATAVVAAAKKPPVAPKKNHDFFPFNENHFDVKSEKLLAEQPAQEDDLQTNDFVMVARESVAEILQDYEPFHQVTLNDLDMNEFLPFHHITLSEFEVNDLVVVALFS